MRTTVLLALLLTAAFPGWASPGPSTAPPTGPSTEAPVIESQAMASAGPGAELLYYRYTCCDCCLDVSCSGMDAIDRDCCGGRMGDAGDVLLAYLTLGTLIGLGGGAVLGIIPGLLFAAASIGLSAQNGAAFDDALPAGVLSFFGTVLLVSLVVGILGFFVGGLAGSVHAAIVFFVGRDRRPPPRRRPREVPPPRRRAPARDWDDDDDRYDDDDDDDEPPRRSEPEPEPEPERPPGDEPPPLAMTY